MPKSVSSQKDSVVYQLKITLKGSKPPIWRRMLVSSETRLDKLARIIMAAMGWDNSHLHEFETKTARYGPPEDDGGFGMGAVDPRKMLAEIFGVDPGRLDDLPFGPPPLIDEAEVTLAQVVPNEGGRIAFTYDFGDGWDHTIVVEKILPADPATEYPVCVKGVRACPPEDCGGIWAYQSDMLPALKDPKSPQHRHWKGWIGKFDPEAFDLDLANSRLKHLDRYAVERDSPDDSWDDDFAEFDFEELDPEELEEAYEEIRGELQELCQETTKIPGGYAFRFAGDMTVWMVLAQIAIIERHRNPKLGFAMEVEPGEDGPIRLRITGEGTKELAAKLFDLDDA